jgi:hypothetical protein
MLQRINMPRVSRINLVRGGISNVECMEIEDERFLIIKYRKLNTLELLT